MNARLVLLFLWFAATLSGPRVALSASDAAAMDRPIPPAAEILAKLRKEHPRLLATTDDFARLQRQVTNDATLKAWHEKLRTRAERILGEPPSQYEIPDGLRLLSVSRRVVDRVYTLGLLYRLDRDARYAERAWRELETAANFKDWNPRHFLDTAEMTHAFAIGYDWLYDAWTPAQRDQLQKAAVEKGLRLGVECYRATPSYGWWTKARHNWNQVCNGGIGMGALALADVEPELAGEFLHNALASLQLPMREFAPDGAWAEGPGYWNYATSYNVVFLAALQTALGTDFDLSAMAGFDAVGLFPINLTGPLGRTFNYADCSDGPIHAPQMLWLARRFHAPAYSQYESRIASPHAQDLLWFDPADSQANPPPLPLDRYFRGAGVVTLRSDWHDPDAVFIGFKAGDNKANHSHLDLGTFVLDALGVRWAVDLGADDYNLPGYFGDKRWTYYRLRAEGHNTLVLAPDAEPDQDPRAAAGITKFKSQPEAAFAVADLTAAYAKNARKVLRGVALLGRKNLLVQDRIETSKPVDAWWFVHTAAQVQISDDGDTAVLSQNGKRLLVRLVKPARTGKFTVTNAKPLPASPNPNGQAKNEGVRKLAIRLPAVSQVEVCVVFTPLHAGEAEPTTHPLVLPLEAWGNKPWPALAARPKP